MRKNELVVRLKISCTRGKLEDTKVTCKNLENIQSIVFIGRNIYQRKYFFISISHFLIVFKKILICSNMQSSYNYFSSQKATSIF